MKALSQRASQLVRVGREVLRPSMSDRDRISSALRARLGEVVLPLEIQPPRSLWADSAWAKAALTTAAFGTLLGAALFAWPTSVTLSPILRAPQNLLLDELPGTAAPRSSPRSTASEPTAPARASESAVDATRRDGGRLAEEVAILSRATSELHAGHAANALKAVEEHRRKFPNGLLSEERRSAHVQALCALGRRSEAQPELERLSRITPQSPNALTAKRACGVN